MSRPVNRRLACVLVLLLAASALPALAQQEALALPPHRKVTLPNGLTVLLMERRQVPVVSFHYIVRSGAAADPAGKEGLASMTAALLRKGTRTRTADQVSAELDFIGGLMSASAGADFSQGSAEFLRKDLEQGLELFADVLLHPTFPEDEVTKLLLQAQDGVRSAKDRVQAVIGNYYAGFLYGAHPYARPAGGDERSLAAITRADVAAFYASHYRPNHTILAVAGDFATAEMEALLRQRFGAWERAAVKAAALPQPAAPSGRRLLLVDKPDATQTFFYIGNLGIPRTHPDRVAIQVVNTIFGGRFTSMLNSRLRVQSGLTYGAGSVFDQRLARGPFFISTYTRNQTTAQAMDMALEILEHLHQKGVTAEELASGKQYVKGQFPTSIETTDQLARLLATLEFYGLDQSEISSFYARIDALTVEEARRVIARHFPLRDLTFVVIGKAADIEPVVRKYAPEMRRKSISDLGY